MDKKTNIALIGMAGVGKSHIAKKIAAISNYEYLETDKLIAEQAEREGMIYNDLSDDNFLRIEKDVFLRLNGLFSTVIDTGASVIYDKDVMCKIAEFAHIVYIEDDIDVIVGRFNARGPVPLMGIGGKSFEQLFTERRPLYEKYAQFTVTRNNFRNNDAGLVVEQILRFVRDI